MNQQEILMKAFSHRDNPNLIISDTNSNYQIESSHLSFNLNHSSNTINTNEIKGRNSLEKGTNDSKNSLRSSSVIENNSSSSESKNNSIFKDIIKNKDENSNIDESRNQFIVNFSNANSSINNLQVSSNSIVFTKNLDKISQNTQNNIYMNNNQYSYLPNNNYNNTIELKDYKDKYSENNSSILCNYYDITPQKNDNQSTENNNKNYQKKEENKISQLSQYAKLKQINLNNKTQNNSNNSGEYTSRSDENNSFIQSGEDTSGGKKRRICLEKKTPIKYTRSQLKSGEKKKNKSECASENVCKYLNSNNEKTSNSSAQNKSVNGENSAINNNLYKNLNNLHLCGAMSGRKNLMNTFEMLSKDQDKIEDFLKPKQKEGEKDWGKINQILKNDKFDLNNNEYKKENVIKQFEQNEELISSQNSLNSFIYLNKNKNDSPSFLKDSPLLLKNEEKKEKELKQKELENLKRKNDNFSFAFNNQSNQINQSPIKNTNKKEIKTNSFCQSKSEKKSNQKNDKKEIKKNMTQKELNSVTPLNINTNLNNSNKKNLNNLISGRANTEGNRKANSVAKSKKQNIQKNYQMMNENKKMFFMKTMKTSKNLKNKFNTEIKELKEIKEGKGIQNNKFINFNSTMPHKSYSESKRKTSKNLNNTINTTNNLNKNKEKKNLIPQMNKNNYENKIKEKENLQRELKDNHQKSFSSQKKIQKKANEINTNINNINISNLQTNKFDNTQRRKDFSYKKGAIRTNNINTTSSSKGSKNNSVSKNKENKIDEKIKEKKIENKTERNKEIIKLAEVIGGNIEKEKEEKNEEKIVKENENIINENINKNIEKEDIKYPKLKVINNFSNYRKKRQNNRITKIEMENIKKEMIAINSNNLNNTSKINNTYNYKGQIIFSKLNELPGDADSQIPTEEK